jgi:hypothetical protein
VTDRAVARFERLAVVVVFERDVVDGNDRLHGREGIRWRTCCEANR